MFDVAWTELALIGGVALVVMGPEEAPKILYNAGKITRKIKFFIQEMQSHLDTVVQEAEVDQLAKEINEKIGGSHLQFEIDKQITIEEHINLQNKP